MTNEIIYQENRIKKLLYELSSVFMEIELREEFHSDESENLDFELETDRLKKQFENLSKNVYKLCIAYFESKNIPNYLSTFIKEVEPYFVKSETILSSSYDENSGDPYSNLLSVFWSYLSPFPSFGHSNDEALLKRTGLIYLETILENTAVILKALNVTPSKENEVYKNVKLVTQAVFPTAIFPTESFQKTAKCYIPDILIKSLGSAIEYKYADNEQKLINTIDEILIDVKGYDNHPTYKIFFAVFYVKPGICPKKKFEEVWKEKKFPENWKGLMVEGM